MRSRGLKIRSGFIFDQNTCTGCQACQLACTIENGLPPDQSWRSVYTFNESRYPGIPLFHLSLACNHCAEAPCMSACPALAYRRDPDTSAVILDQDRCIGCRYCSWACPYDAPRFDAESGVMSKCTLCNERLKQGTAPACAELCPTGALSYGPLNEESLTSDVEGFSTLGIGPSIKVVPLREGGRAPESSLPAGERYMGEKTPSTASGLRSEWPLAIFTLAAATLFGMATAAAWAGTDVHPALFVTTAFAAMTVSAAHLGRKLRAWRSILNIAQSWLSREIVFFTLFVVTSAVLLIWSPYSRLLGWTAVIVGLATLAAVDMVYKFALRPSITHSAGVLLTGAFLTGVFAASPIVAGLAGLGKMGLYARRKIDFAVTGVDPRLPVSVLRIGLGFVVPPVLWVAVSEEMHLFVVAAALLGELIDRLEFYAELETMTPARRMAADLEKRIEGQKGQVGQ